MGTWHNVVTIKPDYPDDGCGPNAESYGVQLYGLHGRFEYAFWTASTFVRFNRVKLTSKVNKMCSSFCRYFSAELLSLWGINENISLDTYLALILQPGVYVSVYDPICI